MLLEAAELIAPAGDAGGYDQGAIVLLLREWANDSLIGGHQIATFLVAENLNDLHPLLANNAHAAKIKVPLPDEAALGETLRVLEPAYAAALAGYAGRLDSLAHQLAGVALSSVEQLLKTARHEGTAVDPAGLVALKKSLVEKDYSGLIGFVESKRTLDDIYGSERVKAWLRQDIALWKQDDLKALPMGYLFCGPVGTGKTFFVECLAGEAGVPVVKMKNFRDKWVGSTEGNLERIFRLLHALGRCIVFVDEADQALGRRESSSNDSGVSGRIYSMIAEEMSDTDNRGRILWILASSRPDLIEVDIKRPGRIDVKIPLFPTLEPREGFTLLRALCKRVGSGDPGGGVRRPGGDDTGDAHPGRGRGHRRQGLPPGAHPGAGAGAGARRLPGGLPASGPPRRHGFPDRPRGAGGERPGVRAGEAQAGRRPVVRTKPQRRRARSALGDNHGLHPARAAKRRAPGRVWLPSVTLPAAVPAADAGDSRAAASGSQTAWDSRRTWGSRLSWGSPPAVGTCSRSSGVGGSPARRDLPVPGDGPDNRPPAGTATALRSSRR